MQWDPAQILLKTSSLQWRAPYHPGYKLSYVVRTNWFLTKNNLVVPLPRHGSGSAPRGKVTLRRTCLQPWWSDKLIITIPKLVMQCMIWSIVNDNDKLLHVCVNVQNDSNYQAKLSQITDYIVWFKIFHQFGEFPSEHHHFPHWRVLKEIITGKRVNIVLGFSSCVPLFE